MMTYSKCPLILSFEHRKLSREAWRYLYHTTRLIWREKGETYTKMMYDVAIFGSGYLEV